MFVIPENIEETGWSPQKVSNIHCVLQLIRTLVSPHNPVQITSVCQKNMRNANLLEVLCGILMESGVPADILTETINTVAEVIRGNLNNQEYFCTVNAPSNPPRPAIVVLLMSMVNEKQPFLLRCAVLYCFECFLFKNEIGQQQVVQTLLPSTNNNSTLTTGQLLCGGVFNLDPLSNWFSSVALSHTLIENPAQKEQLLRVLLGTNLGTQPVSLLHQCATFLQQTTKLQSKIGLLMLLATWMAHCPPAVSIFLNVPGAMAFLTAQSSATEYDNNEELLQGLCAFLMGICVVFNDNTVPNYSKENLSQLIEKRIGIETYISKLSDISRNEMYAKASKQPQLKAKYPNDLLLEFEFCKLFKALESTIVKTLGAQKQLSNGMTELSLSEQENGLLLQYKDVIRDQDRRLQELQRELSKVRAEHNDLHVQSEEIRIANLQLQDENTLLKAQLSAGAMHPLPDNVPLIENGVGDDRDFLTKIKQLEEENLEKNAELERLRKDQEDLLELLTDQSSRLDAFKARLRELGENIVDDDDSDVNSIDENDVK